MPANLPPQYYEAEKRYREAQGYEGKISILQEMLAIMPKHKGTDKLQADLRAKLSKLKKAAQKKRAPHRRTHPHRIPREGIAQVILTGAPNTGKSSILATLTNATPQIAPYPFTTHEASIGMMSWENIKIQLVDTPPISSEFMLPWLADILKGADLLLIVVDLGEDELLEQVDIGLTKLKKLKIKPQKALTEDKDTEVEEKGAMYKKMGILANKEDVVGGKERLAILREFYAAQFPIISCSTKIPQNRDKVKEKIYQALEVIRIYTKVPGQSPDLEDPVVLKKGSLVIDAARCIHKDFARSLKYARIWGSNKFKGQKVQREHPLEEGDILEFHI